MESLAEQLAACQARLREMLEREERLLADLRSANEFRSLLLTAVAHDVRTPLTSIVGYVSLLGRDGVDDDMRRHAEERIAASAEILRKRIEDLFEVAALDFQGLSRKPFDLRSVVTRAVASVNAVVDLPASVPSVVGDEVSARRVLSQLIETCLHLARGQRITVEVRVHDTTASVVVSERTTSFKPHEVETLFERFFGLPGTPTSPDSGTSLYVAKRLAEAQGGELHVVPGSESGVAFSFSLPVAPRFAHADDVR